MRLTDPSSTLEPPREEVLSARFGFAVVLEEAVMARKKSLRSDLRQVLERRRLVMVIGLSARRQGDLGNSGRRAEVRLRTQREVLR